MCVFIGERVLLGVLVIFVDINYCCKLFVGGFVGVWLFGVV